MAIKFDHSFSRIDKILPKTAKQYKLQEAMVKHQVLRYWEEALLAFLPGSQGVTKAIEFEDGVLTVASLSPSLVREITQFESRLLYALNQLMGKEVVKTIKLEI